MIAILLLIGVALYMVKLEIRSSEDCDYADYCEAECERIFRQRATTLQGD